jgi:hypothetical protein
MCFKRNLNLANIEKFLENFRFWTNFRYFLLIHESDSKFDEDHEYLFIWFFYVSNEYLQNNCLIEKLEVDK